MSNHNLPFFHLIDEKSIDDVESQTHKVDRLLSLMHTHLANFLDQEGYKRSIDEACVLADIIQKLVGDLITRVS